MYENSIECRGSEKFVRVEASGVLLSQSTPIGKRRQCKFLQKSLNTQLSPLAEISKG